MQQDNPDDAGDADPARPRETPPRDLGQTQIVSAQAPKTVETYRVLDTQHTMPKKWQPQKPSALIRDSEGRPSCRLPSTRSTGVGGF